MGYHGVHFPHLAVKLDGLTTFFLPPDQSSFYFFAAV